ncbi:MAG: class I mannose-6-phosphate isomerase [Pirellulales bacterium]|nr:class I mannose-6-phosphate isomerase [Pirellulales bacterium]
MSSCDHLIQFRPLFRRYLWGGRRLGTVLGRPIGDGEDYAESWELVDRGNDQSIVASGPFAGWTLNELIMHHGSDVVGSHWAAIDRFPLLMKFLDCNHTLSVQVHPNDEQAAKLTPPDLGKTEAWVVLATEPGSRMYAGLRQGVTPAELEAGVRSGDVLPLLHWFEPQVGDCVFIPAGAVHALGAGLLIAEVQQASDTTYRLFDWNRLDAQGRPRQLHVDESLAMVDYSLGPIKPQSPRRVGSGRDRLVDCDKFVIDRCRPSQSTVVGGDDRFHLLVVVSGVINVLTEQGQSPLAYGQTALLPAAAGAIPVQSQAGGAVLDIYLPK